jgi:hypothetical protein
MTLAKIQNVDTLLHDGVNTNCHNVGPVGGPVGNDASGNPTATALVGNLTALFTNPDSTHITVAAATGLTVGQTIYVDTGANAEAATRRSRARLTLSAPLSHTHRTASRDEQCCVLGRARRSTTSRSRASTASPSARRSGRQHVERRATIASVGTAGAGGSGLTSAADPKVHRRAPFATFTTPSVADLLDKRAGRAERQPERARLDCAVTLMGLGDLGPRAQRAPEGERGPGSRSWSPACLVHRPTRPPPELGPQPNDDRRGPLPSHELVAAQINGCRASARCRR